MEDETGSLERVREKLYDPSFSGSVAREPLTHASARSLPHEWEEEKPLPITPNRGARQVHLASIFFSVALTFFFIAVGIAGYFFYFGGNSVSNDKVMLTVQGPTTIAGGDIVPLSLTITNTNKVPIENATIEVDLPDGTRDAQDVSKPYPRYTETINMIASGATITRPVHAVIFGGAGQTLAIPVSFSYSTASSNSVFVKKISYDLAISSTPLSVSAATVSEAIAGEPITFSLIVRSNTSVPLNNVVLTANLPYEFSVSTSSVPMSGSSFFLGQFAPGVSKTIQLTGVLKGQEGDKNAFHFTVGTANAPQDSALAVTYMTQDVTIPIAAPFIATDLSINGDNSPNPVLQMRANQNVTVSFTNKLSSNITGATITVVVSGTGVDYSTIQSTNGFYNSATHSVIFSSDTNQSLASLPPGGSGTGSLSFSTVSSSSQKPTVTLTTSVTGTRIGQGNVPDQIHVSMTRVAKVSTSIALSARASHATEGSVSVTGPVPPRVGQTTTYAVVFHATNTGNAIADGAVTATLPIYVTYTDQTSGDGTFSYNSASRTVTWNTGSLEQGAEANGIFQVSLTPSSSQKGDTPILVNAGTFSGHDRFANVSVSAGSEPVSTDTKGSAGYVPGSGTVQ